jgi:hypothetical protein
MANNILGNSLTENFRGMEFFKQSLTSTRAFFKMENITVKARQLGIQETFIKAITKMDKSTDMESIRRLTERATKEIGFRGNVMVKESKLQQRGIDNRFILRWTKNRVLKYDSLVYIKTTSNFLISNRHRLLLKHF